MWTRIGGKEDGGKNGTEVTTELAFKATAGERGSKAGKGKRENQGGGRERTINLFLLKNGSPVYAEGEDNKKKQVWGI